MALTGIIYRKDTKENLITQPPVEGEVVYAEDTKQYGFLNVDGVSVNWTTFDGDATSWGTITGSIGNQIDLQDQFNTYASTDYVNPRLDSLDDKTAFNESLINQNENAISQNTTDISGNTARITTNENAISQNANDISGNTDRITINESVINNNTTLIGTKENYLGYPNTSGEVLTSLINGDRSWLKLEEAGLGDMIKSIYDTDNSGIVDNAETVNGLTVETAVPVNALFTDTVYDDSQLQADIDINTDTIILNKSEIDTNTLNITTNTADILINANKITANTTNINNKEDFLENPTLEGQILSSAIDGTRTWINMNTGTALNYIGLWDASTNSPTIADSTGKNGDFYKVSVTGTQNLGSGTVTYKVGETLIHDGTLFGQIDNPETVATVAGRTGNILLDKNDVGLSNVDNIADLNKIVSNDTQIALDLKQDNLGFGIAGTILATNSAGDGTEWISNSVPPNLAYIALPEQGEVTITDGVSAIIPLGNLTNAGLLSPSDFNKLADIIVSQEVNLDTMETEIGVLSNLNTSITDTLVNAINEVESETVTNNTNIATNATNIATNVTNIATNVTNIETNATNIATNVTNIATKEDSLGYPVSDGNILVSTIAGVRSWVALTDEAAIWGKITGTLLDQSDLQVELDDKASIIHTHAISDVTDLQGSLDSKVDDNQVLTNVPSGALFTDTVYDDTTIQAEVALNTAKVGITTAQADEIIENTLKISYTDATLVATHTTDIATKIQWKNIWAAGTYEINDMVRDNEWTMIANNQTTDRPSPVLSGIKEWQEVEDPAWTSTEVNLGDITYGSEFISETIFDLVDARVWIEDSTYEYIVQMWDMTIPENPTLIRSEILLTGLPSGSWFELNNQGSIPLITPGVTYLIRVIVKNHAADINYTDTWRHLNPTPPGTGIINSLTEDTTIITINKTSGSAGTETDRSADLILLGDNDYIDAIQTSDSANNIQYVVTGAVIDEGTYISIPVTMVSQGDSIPNNADVYFNWTITTPTDINYKKMNDKWLGNTQIRGYISTDINTPNSPLILDDNFYGIDILTEAYITSIDWDTITAPSNLSGTSISTWGKIIGDIPNQTDLQTALDSKVDDTQVLTDVPSGALFTDTVYDDTTIQAEVDLNTAKETNIVHPLVETAVPIGALFTDTVYDDTTIQGEVDLNTVKISYTDATLVAQHTTDISTNTIDIATKQSKIVTTLIDGVNIAIDMTESNFEVIIAQNSILDNPTNQTKGQMGYIIIQQDTTGGFTPTFGTSYRFKVAPTLNTSPNAFNVFRYYTIDTDNLAMEFVTDYV